MTTIDATANHSVLEETTRRLVERDQANTAESDTVRIKCPSCRNEALLDAVTMRRIREDGVVVLSCAKCGGRIRVRASLRMTVDMEGGPIA